TKHMFEDPPAPSEVAPEADIPPEVEALILKAMQKDRGLRFQSLRELMDAILDDGTDAAPVAVVQERLSRPITGPTRFRPRTAPTERGAPARGGAAGFGLAIAAVLGGAGVAAYGRRGASEPPISEDSPQPPAVVVAAATETPPKVEAPKVEAPRPVEAPEPAE